ncbi:Chromosome segregation protein SMC-like [Pseudomonas chlororaphis subsp. aureofaciens]|nr:ATP-binding protein [Pseudomonas chlororaphis]AZE24660.1 Chromosome segregation protein SMC-like [Pseudomonas chlororaphis subsp. aureofaciens]
MKLLEHIVLVQFFLYGGDDLETGLNTAFLGPNGTGKSAILDALQVVMLAADGNRTHFNAAGEGKKRARTLRDYCLGAYVPGVDEYARTSANTYVDLVFRDSETGIPFTAGVSLSARIEDTHAVVNGLYILPGVALTPKHHQQTEGQQETVMPWRDFRHVAADLCRLEGQAAPLITQNKDDFVRHLLIDHLAGPGDKPNSKSLRAAFARSLKLSEEIDDLSDTLRQHLIEPMPSRVKAFRDRLDDVRKLRDLIRALKERIEHASATVDKYTVVKRERTTEVNLTVLKHTYEIEQHGETLDTAEAEIEQLTESIGLGELEQERAKTELLNAKAARDLTIAELNSNPEYLNQATLAQNLRYLEDAQKAKNQELHLQFAAMLAAIASCAPHFQTDAHVDLLRQTQHQVTMLLKMQEESQIPSAVMIQTALRSLSDVYDVIHHALTQAEREQGQAAARHQDALTASGRADLGLTELHNDTIRLIGVLTNAGIDVTPVCDLVTISDASWQPAIESWLGRHVEALLVPADQELDAIQVYRSNAASGVYGVKLALPSRTQQWNAPGNEQYAAQLIQGENIDAVRYLQGELGRTALVETNEQLRAGTKVISKEGMASAGGGVERRRLPGINQLRIGRNDAHARRQRSAQHVQDTAEQLRTSNEVVTRLGTSQKKLSPFSDAATLQQVIENQVNELSKTANETRIQKSAFESTLTDSLSALREKKEAADNRQANAERAATTWTEDLARLKVKLENKQSHMQSLKELLEHRLLAERQARQNILYGANDVDRLRNRLDGKHGENWPDKLIDLDETLRNASKAAANADLDAWVLFTKYVSDNNLQNHSITNENWIGAFEFIFKERQRLEDLELVEQEQKAEQAYEAAVKVFRTDVAQALLSGFDQLEEQIKSLTAVLKAAPPFTNNERYEFRYKVVDEHRSLYDFLYRIRAHGSSEDDLFGGPGETPEAFRMLVDGDISSTLLDETSPLNDHRRFFSYDVEVFQHNTSVGMLSKRFGPASGGEHRTPLYLISVQHWPRHTVNRKAVLQVAASCCLMKRSTKWTRRIFVPPFSTLMRWACSSSWQDRRPTKASFHHS